MVKLDARKSGSFKIDGDIEIHRLGFGAMRITGPRVWVRPLTGPRQSGPSNACLSLVSISSTLRTPTGRMSPSSLSTRRYTLMTAFSSRPRLA